ncbi:MAG: hypothetical protein ABI844_13265 [Saprospiraceae bacterium]
MMSLVLLNASFLVHCFVFKCLFYDKTDRKGPEIYVGEYGSSDIVDENDDVQYPNHGYMEDVGNPTYQDMQCDMLIQ